MNRGLPLAATLLLAPSAALAQPDPPAPDSVDAAPPAAAPARAKPATTLGAPWQIVVGGSVGSLRSVSYDGRDGSEKQAVFGPSVDVFVAPRLSLGAAFLVGADEVPGTEVSRSFFQVGLRLGYVLPLGERMSLWPSVWGGVASGHEQSRLVGDTQTSWSGARFGADVPLLFHVAPHAFVGLGPSLVVDRAGATPDDRSALVGEKRVVVGGVLRVGGYWGGASTPDGVAAPEAPAGPGFAEPGNVVVTDAIGLGASIASYSPDSDARSVSYGLEPSVDVFVGRVSGTPVSLGGGAILARQTTETPGGLSARVTRGTLGAGIRVGVDVPITRGVSFWPMVGLSVLFEHTERIPAQRETVAVAGSTVVTPQGGEAPRYDGVTRFGPTAFAPFLLHPAPHVVLGMGPLWERDVVTYQPNTNVPKRTTLGARGVLGIWFLRSSSPSCCSGDGRSGAWATRGGSATVSAVTVGVPPPRPPRAEPRRVRVEYEVEEREGRWLLDEEDMPEIPLHDAVIQLLELVLAAFAEREARSALITSNLGCRWDPADARVGVDPDVLLVEPMPPEGEKTTTLRVWEPGHAPPRVAVEVVSEQSGRKDYVEGPARYARLGAHELWIFDPLLVGPSDTGGPFVLQVWRRNEQGAMAREHAGAGPARSEELGAWLVVTDGGTRLRLADDPLGERLWLTKAEGASRQAAAESRRAEAESRRAEAESRRAEAESRRADEQKRLLDAAEAEVARLRAELARRGPLGARSGEEVRGGPADEVEPRVAPRFPWTLGLADAGNGWRRPRGIGESSEESPGAGALELTKDGHVRA